MIRLPESPGFRTLLPMLFILLTGSEIALAQSGGRFSFEFQNAPLDHALYQISQRTGADIIYESHLTSGVRVTGEYQEEELGSILYDLLRPAGLEARRIRTGMYVLRYSLRREMEPVMKVTDGSAIINAKLRGKDRIHTNRPPVPLRDRPFFWN